MFFALKQPIPQQVSKYVRSLAVFVQLQLVITLVSWPVLISWGLPLSVGSFLGNLIFSPFLLIFLLICALIFFTELCHLPNSFLIAVLEHLNATWLWLIEQSDRSWLIYCVRPPLGIALIIISSSFILLLAKKLNNISSRITALVLFLALIASYFYCLQPRGLYTKELNCFNKKIYFIRSHHKTVLIDPGILGSRVSAAQLVSYTLMPELIQAEGINQIDYIISLKASPMTFQALARLCEHLPVKHLYAVNWCGALSYRGWQAWEHLLAALKKHKTKLHLIDKEITLTLNGEKLFLVPESKTSKKNSMRYQAVKITGTINHEPINIAAY